MNTPEPLEQREWVKYDGSIPEDARLLQEQVNAPALALLGPLFAAIGIGGLLKLAFLAFSIFMYFKNRKAGVSKDRGQLEAERAYGFQLENTVQPDTPLSIVYGEHIVFPHYFYQKLSNKRNSNRLDFGLGIGEGPIESVSEVKVNDVAFAELTGENSYTVHLGDNSGADVDARLNKVAYSQDFSDEIEPGQSILRAGFLSDANELEVGVLLPEGLFRVDEEKGVKSASVFLRFEYRRLLPLNQPYVHAFDTTITEKHRGELRYTFTLARDLDPAYYAIRVTNLSPDRDDFEFTDSVFLDFYNQYHQEEFEVPHFAYLGMTLEATSGLQGRTPEISCLVKGRKVRVYTSPSVYVTSWSDNPVWCLADLLTDPRYGLGNLISYDDLDLESFIAVAQYCDQTDVNGMRRGQLDLVVNTLRPALDWIETIINTFGGILRMTGEKVSLAVYRDEASVQSFGESNILEGSFKYEYADPNESSRINTIKGAFLNREKNWTRDVVTVQISGEVSGPEDVIEKNVDIIGVSRPKAVEAQLRKTLKSLRSNIRSATWDSDLSTINCEVGDVVSVTHSLPSWTNKKFRVLQIDEEGLGGKRTLRALEHNSAVFDDSVTDVVPVIETSLVNPFEAAGDIESLDVFPFFVQQQDGGIRQDILVSWSVADGTFYGIDHFEVFYDEDAGTVLPNGTAFNASDTGSYRFFRKSDSVTLTGTGVSDGTVVSGTRTPSVIHAGNTYPPDTSFTITGVNENNFYDVAVVGVTNNFIRQDINNAVRELVFAQPYGEAPDNTASFTATFQGEDVVFAWTAVSVSDLGGYEIRTANSGWGDSSSLLVWRGNQTQHILRAVNFRSRTFYIKTFNRSGVYSSTVRSAVASNPAPPAVTMSAAVVNGKTARLSWSTSSAADVTGYRIDISTTAGFTPSNSTRFKTVTGRQVVSELFSETDTALPPRYARVAALDALSERLGDFVWSNAISFQCEEEVSFFDSVSINLINDSDCNGIAPGYWTGNFTYGSSTIQLAPGRQVQQIIPLAWRRLSTDFVRFRFDARRVGTGGVTGGLYLSLTTLTGGKGIATSWDASGLSTIWTQFEFVTERSRFQGGSEDWRVILVNGGGSSATVEIDHVMLHDGADPLLWVPHSLEQIQGYTNWVGTTQITENAITTGKLATNAITADKIATGQIEARHLSADIITANEIEANSITADLYAELRNTLYFKFAGEVDDGHPLDVLFHLPEELVALTEGGIQQIKVSYAVKPFRATSKAGTALAGGSTLPATLTTGPGAHSHVLRIDRTSSNITYLYTTDGATWYRTQPSGTTGGGSGTTTFEVESADGHRHNWVVNNASVSTPPSGARVLWVNPSGTLYTTNNGATITLQNANGTVGSHTHTIAVGSNGTGVPTNGRVSKGTGTTGSGPDRLYCFETNGINAQTSTVNGPNGYQVTIPAHTHEVQFGVYEEANSVTVGVRRSDNGFSFESADYHSSPSSSIINLNLNGGNFYTAGAGAGFKALRFVVTGANEGRCRLDGVVMVKVDISA